LFEVHISSQINSNLSPLISVSDYSSFALFSSVLNQYTLNSINLECFAILEIYVLMDFKAFYFYLQKLENAKMYNF